MFTNWRNNEISFRKLSTLAIPAILSGIIEPIITFTDQYFVGQLDGNSLAGISIATTSLFFIVWLFAFIPSTSSSLVALYYGEDDKTKIGVVISKAVYLALLFSGAVAFAAFLSTPYIFSLHKASSQVNVIAQSYFQIRCLGIPLMMLTYCALGIFRGYQNTIWPLQIAAVGAVVNIGLDALLIHGLDGMIEPMGVAGSAWASVISQLVMVIIAFSRLLKLPSDWSMRNAKLVSNRLLIGMSVNMIVRLFALNLTILIAQRIASNISDAHLTSLSVLMNYWLFSSFFIDGYATAALALAGKFKGAKRNNLIAPLLYKTTLINGIVALLISVLGYYFVNNLTFIWPDMDEVMSVSQTVMLLFLFTIVMGSITFTLDGIFIGLGRMKELRNTLILATGIFLVPLYFLGENWSYLLLWSMIGSWITIRAVVPGVYWFLGR